MAHFRIQFSNRARRRWSADRLLSSNIGEGRRLAHLMRVKRKWIKSDHPIRCTVDDEHNPVALSLAENVLHEAMHPRPISSSHSRHLSTAVSLLKMSPRNTL